MRLSRPPVDPDWLALQLAELERLTHEGDTLEVVGKLGATGQSLGVPHLHFGLCPDQPCRGPATATVDPLPFIVGCFDPAKRVTYSEQASGGKPRLVLTYPVRCGRLWR